LKPSSIHFWFAIQTFDTDTYINLIVFLPAPILLVLNQAGRSSSPEALRKLGWIVLAKIAEPSLWTLGRLGRLEALAVANRTILTTIGRSVSARAVATTIVVVAAFGKHTITLGTLALPTSAAVSTFTIVTFS
jgi:hypothetical protein